MGGISLRRRLLALLLSTTTMVWLGVAAVGYFEARHEAEELLDAHLAQFAGLIVAQAGEDSDEVDTERVPLLHRYARKAAFQVWRRGKVLSLHSANAPAERLSPVEEGFSEAPHAGERWRIFGTWDRERENLIQVGERVHARDEIVDALGRNLLLALAAALPLLALAVWIAIGRGLRPLELLREQLARRRPVDREPLDARGAPLEVAPLVAEMNRLLERMHEMIERERRLTADAAHELRTPLAALSTQAQVARATASDAVREEALDALVAGAERSARLVEQMLTLARLEAGGAETRRETVDLHELARAALAEVAAGAIAKELDIELEEGDAVVIQGYEGVLGVLARNLADNAVRYTPRGGKVRVVVRREGRLARLEIVNTGQRIAPEEFARMGERFHRGALDGEPGSGLGLSIVKLVAELHEGSVRFAPGADGSGLCVTVELPALAH